MVAVFDAHADRYDEVAQSALGIVLRERVRAVVEPLLDSTTSAIDLGCGTGLDTQWLAKRVATVRGIDRSPKMIERARIRSRSSAGVTLSVGSLDDLDSAEPVDLVLANFGVVNCLGPLDQVGSRIADRLAPEGHVVVVTMPVICPIERAVALATINRALWKRRSGTAAEATYAELDLRYANAGQLARAWPRLDLVHSEALGLVLPPFEQRGLVSGRPRLLAALAGLDRRLASLGGYLGCGDHHIAVFTKRRA